MQNLIDKGLSRLIAFTNLPHVVAVRDGVILILTPTLIGSAFLLIAALPIPGYYDFMVSLFGAGWQAKVLYPVGATFGIMGLLVVLTVSYRLAIHYRVDAVGASLVAFMSFLLLTPYQVSVPELVEPVEAIPVALMGSQGLFVAILTALLATEVFRFITQKGWTITMPESVPEGVSRSFSVLLPGFFTILVVWLVRLFVESVGLASVHEVVQAVLDKPLAHMTGSLGGAVTYTVMVHMLWSFGIHGHAIMDTIFVPTMLQLLDQNREAYQLGLELPNIVMKPFFDTYVHMGGSGATLPLVLAMILFARSKHLKSVGRLSLASGIFQINEPVMFGIPIVLNPLLVVPFIVIPTILTITTYFAMSWGFLPKPTGVALPWTTPIFISGYLVSGGSLLGTLWQVLNFLIATAIWLPFFRLVDRMESEKVSD